jgi:CheY-like chemotaxis protein
MAQSAQRYLERKPVILVAEDDDTLRMLVGAFLSDEGYAIEEATNVSEALTTILSKDIDLVFTDINMPGKLKGDSMAKWLATHRANVPVIMTSGYERPLPEAGNQRFISKPYALGAVETEIRELLQNQAQAH